MEINFDFTKVSFTSETFDVIRSNFSDLQFIIDNLPVLLKEKKLLSFVVNLESKGEDSEYLLENYSKQIKEINDIGTLEVLYAHYTFIISGVFKELQDLSNLNSSQSLRLPSNLSEPILILSNKLRVPPVLTYYSHLLLNWNYSKSKPIRRFSLEPQKNLENDFEKGFMAIHIRIEKKSSELINELWDMVNVFQEKGHLKVQKITEHFGILESILIEIRKILNEMYKRCSPEEYLKYIRLFLASYPKIQLVDNETINLVGPSAAQSPTLFLISSIFQARVYPNSSLSTVLETAIQSIPPAYIHTITYFSKKISKNLPLIKENCATFKAFIDLYCHYLYFLMDHFNLVSDYIIKPFSLSTKSKSVDKKGTGTSKPEDLWLRIKLIHKKIQDLISEYNKEHNQLYKNKVLTILNDKLQNETMTEL